VFFNTCFWSYFLHVLDNVSYLYVALLFICTRWLIYTHHACILSHYACTDILTNDSSRLSLLICNTILIVARNTQNLSAYVPISGWRLDDECVLAIGRARAYVSVTPGNEIHYVSLLIRSQVVGTRYPIPTTTPTAYPLRNGAFLFVQFHPRRSFRLASLPRRATPPHAIAHTATSKRRSYESAIFYFTYVKEYSMAYGIINNRLRWAPIED